MNIDPGKTRPDGEPLPDPFPGEYRILALLGSGSFGKVWLAEDLNLQRLVALKTLIISRENSSVLASLKAEARLMATMRHPNVVGVHAWLQSGGEHFLVLQYVPGGSLADRLRTGPLSWQEAVRYIADVGDGLVEVHARGIVHRDVKPANILWDPDRDEALLTDFGVSSRLTERTQMAGSPAFMPAEAFEGKVSPSGDVYALAVSLFQLITSEVPFPGEIGVLPQKIRKGLPTPDPRFAGMPEAIENVIRSGLTPDPARRPNLNGFLDALRASLNHTLVDALAPTDATKQPSHLCLKLMTSREIQPGVYQPVVTTQPKTIGITRDMKKVPRPPQQVSLRTGDRVRVEVAADRPGYVTVFNIGPTGNLNLLYPDDPQTSPGPRLEPDAPLRVVDIVMTPPTGRERLFAVWSRLPLELPIEELRSLAGGEPVQESRPYLATRDMKRVGDAVKRLSASDCHSVVLELDHVT
jgi:serine/threonine protein kinase